jgi:hypothetical protein
MLSLDCCRHAILDLWLYQYDDEATMLATMASPRGGVLFVIDRDIGSNPTVARCDAQPYLYGGHDIDAEAIVWHSSSSAKCNSREIHVTLYLLSLVRTIYASSLLYYKMSPGGNK